MLIFGPNKKGEMKVNLPKHILELLIQDESVHVPGLGNFSFINKSASFGEGRKSLLPPGKKIAYSEDHDNSDGKLISLISEKNELSLEKSQAFLEEFSSEVLSSLMSSNQVEIAYLGQLEKDEKGIVNFISNTVTEERINKWRPELKLPPAQAVEAAVFKEEKSKPAKPTSKVGTRVEPVVPIQNTISSTEDGGLGLKSWLIGFLGLVGLLALLIFGVRACSSSESSFKTKAEIENQEIIERESKLKQEEAEEVEEEINYGEEIDDSAVANDNDIKEDGVQNSENANKIEGNCIIILGSFTNADNVQAITRKVRNSRFDLYTENHGPYTRVGVQTDCDDISEDYKAFLRKIRSQFNIEGAWYLNPELKDI